MASQPTGPLRHAMADRRRGAVVGKALAPCADAAGGYSEVSGNGGRDSDRADLGPGRAGSSPPVAGR